MLEQAEQDFAVIEADSEAFAPSPAEPLAMTLQFIPERVIDKDGTTVLRAVILALPSLDPTSTLDRHPAVEDWPNEAWALLSELDLYFSATDTACTALPTGTQRLTVKPVWPAADGTSLTDLWQQVLDGPERGAIDPSLASEVVIRRRQRSMEVDRWSTIRYDPGNPKTGRIANFGLAAIDEALEPLEATFALAGLARSGEGIFEAMADLFRPNPGVGGAFAAQAEEDIAKRIQGRGLAAATGGLKSAASGPFDRGMDDPGPDKEPSRVLKDTITALLQADQSAADAAYAGTFQRPLAASRFAAKLKYALTTELGQAASRVVLKSSAGTPAAEEIAALTAPPNVGALIARPLTAFLKSDAGAGEWRSLTTRFLVSARPDGGRKSPKTMDGRDLTPEQEAIVETEVDGPQRRLAGLLAVPALARAANVVLQVEIPLTDLPRVGLTGKFSDAQFFVGVVPKNTAEIAAPFVWTACQMQTVPGAVWNGEAQEILTHRFFVPAEHPKLPLPARKHVFGTLDLSDGAEPSYPRYRFTSLDAASRAAGIVHVGEAETQGRRAGIPADNAVPPPRTAGIVLLDSLAAEASQVILARQDLSNKAPAEKRADIRYACDLVTGYHADIGVAPRNDNPLRAWRPLGRRKLTYGESEKGLVEAVRDSLEPDAEAMLDRLSETVVRPSTKVVLDEDTAAARREAAVALETLLQWEIDPLGAACLNPDLFPRQNPIPGKDDYIVGGTDMIGKIKEDLPWSGPRPPRAELGREYYVGMRAVYPGGVTLSVEEASAVYDYANGGRGTRGEAYTFRRQNLPAPPVVALLENTRFRPGDKLDTLIVRTTDEATSIEQPARRVFFLSGLPLDEASQCPHPDSTEDKPRRALDDRPTIGLPPYRGAPLGGLLTVALDRKTGGLVLPDQSTEVKERTHPDVPPPRRKEVVFKVDAVPFWELRDRKMHYYPDPLVDALAFELVDPAKGGTPTGEQIELECYDERYYQAVPAEFDRNKREPCGFPHAMPVVLEVRRGGEGQLATFRRDDPSDFGYLDERGIYRNLRPGKTPPPGTITVRRLMLFLAPGVEVDVRCRSRLRKDSERYIASLNTAQALLAPFRQALKDTLDPGDTAEAAIGRIVRRVVSENGVATQVKALHAVQRPRAPLIDGRLAYMRRDVSQADWPAWAEREWPSADLDGDPQGTQDPKKVAGHQPGAATTFVGGHTTADQRVSSSFWLDVSYSDMRDRPGGFDVGSNGLPKAKPGNRYVVTIPVRQRGVDEDREVEIPLQAEGLPDKNLMLKLPDARAYHLTLSPRSVSRFGNAIFTDPVEGRLTATGAQVSFWVDATRRPDALGYVEFLPVFVWEQRGASRRMGARLMWRANKALASLAGGLGEAKGEWFSSGADEMLAILFAKANDDGGPLSEYVTRLSGDAIRLDAPFSTYDPIDYFKNAASGYEASQKEAFVPAPGKADPPGGALQPSEGRDLRLLAHAPRYDAGGNYWYVDLDIDHAGRGIGAPWVRLGLARYQPHAVSQVEVKEEEETISSYADLHCSQPSTLEFALQPRRRVEVKAERAGGRWHLLVRVFGVAGNTPGSTLHSQPGSQSPATAEAPYFRATVLRDRAFLPELFGAAEVVKARVEGEGQVIAQGAGLPEIWKRTIELDFNPEGRDCHVFVEEFDAMMSAYGNERVLSGPRFMCRVEV